MTPDLDALAALLAAATATPWHERGKHEVESAGGTVVACGAYGEYGCMPVEDRALIVAAINALPALIEAARREAELREALEGLAREGTLPWEQFGPGKQDVRLRRAYHDALNQARQLLHDNAGTATWDEVGEP